MEHIAERLKSIDRNIVIVGADPVTLHGFTMVPNVLLTHQGLSVGAKLTYAMLLRYHWTNDDVYPGQAALAKDMGAGERSIRAYLKELQAAGLLEIKQRGLGKTNLYSLHVSVQGSSIARRSRGRRA
jgi:hypothetical protein